MAPRRAAPGDRALRGAPPRLLAPDGSIDQQLPAFASDTRLLVRLYRAMVLVRASDVKAVALQRTGRLGTYAASLGQEAVSVGTASAMRDEDVCSRPIATTPP
jgi:2-oxoisovalerate dehydrogenase E1 component alpha subunit